MTLLTTASLALSALLASAASHAAPEVQIPSLSPRASVTQQVGITKITVAYNSPAVRGRPIWRTVAAPGSLWRTGEGVVPTITFTRDVVFAGTAVAAGVYSLLTIPSAVDWTVILNRDASLTRMALYRPDLDVVRASVRARTAPHRERLTFLFSDFSDEQASLDLEWDDRRISISIQVHTSEQIATAISALDNAWRWYADAAAYMLETKNDYDAGLGYINHSLALAQNWRNLWIKASLLAAKGDYRDARAHAERAYQMGREQGAGFTLESAVRQALDTWDQSPKRDRPPAPERAAPGAQPAPLPEMLAAAKLSVRVREPDQSPSSPKPPGPAEIGPLFKQRRADLQSCYERALRRDPTLTRARITVSVSIRASGLVKSVSIDSRQTSPALDSCIKDTIARWVFPISPVEYETEFPVVLRGGD